MESGDLQKLLVSELNRYLKHYKLISDSTKAEKIRWILLRVLHGEDGQWEDINESTDEEAKEGGTEDDSKEIDGSGDDESEEDNVLAEWSSGPDSQQLLVNRNVIALMKVIRYGLSLKVIQRKRNFMVLIEFANS